jgi:two-component system response regulator AtoC
MYARAPKAPPTLPDELIVIDPEMRRTYDLVVRLAAARLPVLITGETGTGKERVATALHAMSPRAPSRLIALNCAALNEKLVESELFGHARGAFSGADAARAGMIEAASGSTLLLDEVGELSLPIQAKLLRVLESGRVMRVGEVHERAVDIRIVAATNRNLEAEVHAGHFRRDLYYRLSAALVHLPPLRQRLTELPLLAAHFLSEGARCAGRSAMSLHPEALNVLCAYPWPGNVRELKHVMAFLAATLTAHEVRANDVRARLTTRLAGEPAAAADDVTFVDPPDRSRAFRPLADELRELELTRIQEALSATGGQKTRAATLLGMPLRTLHERIKQYGLAVPLRASASWTAQPPEAT